jgi:hypothetical protein
MFFYTQRGIKGMEFPEAREVSVFGILKARGLEEFQNSKGKEG